MAENEMTAKCRPQQNVRLSEWLGITACNDPAEIEVIGFELLEPLMDGLVDLTCYLVFSLSIQPNAPLPDISTRLIGM